MSNSKKKEDEKPPANDDKAKQNSDKSQENKENPGDQKDGPPSKCGTVTSVNMVRNGDFLLPPLNGEIVFGNVIYWDVPSPHVDEGYRVGLVKSGIHIIGGIRVPGNRSQCFIMAVSGSSAFQNVTGFKPECVYFCNILAVTPPNAVEGYLTVYLDDSILMPETYIPKAVDGKFVNYGPFEITATKTSHRIKLVLTGLVSQGPLLSVLVANVSVTSSKSAAAV
jgi:hypothetical protein